jgi:hypothetical protein
MFKQALIHLTSDECSALFYGCEAYYATGELLYIYRIYITHSERTMCVGLYGVMNDKMYAIFNTV